MKEFISIFKPKIARHLLRKGYQIVDIKASKDNCDRTVFVFKNENGLMEEVIKFQEN